MAIPDGWGGRADRPHNLPPLRDRHDRPLAGAGVAGAGTDEPLGAVGTGSGCEPTKPVVGRVCVA